jgi:succinate dehydrogenase / fumarate reductase cytochrome b subunit
MLAVYVIAMIAICWHFSYGVWLFAAKWGITPGTVARKRFGYVCAALGLGLVVMGLASIWAFVGPEYRNAPDNPVPVVSLMVAPPVMTAHAGAITISI